jgi:hypothetical protein
MHKRKKTISYEAYELEYVFGPKNKVLETQFEYGKKKKQKKTKKNVPFGPENKTLQKLILGTDARRN